MHENKESKEFSNRLGKWNVFYRKKYTYKEIVQDLFKQTMNRKCVFMAKKGTEEAVQEWFKQMMEKWVSA